MFSGIVEEAAEVLELDRKCDPAKLRVRSSLEHQATAIGDSIALDGVCLTVVSRNGGELAFDLAAETLRRTALGSLGAGRRVNLERSLKLGDRISGHLVSGHVDATAALLRRDPDGNCERFEFELAEGLRPFVAEKGSVCLSGISLTVGEVSPDRFCVYIIPHTSALTNFPALKPGDRVNVEVDLLARYVNAALAAREEGAKGQGVSMELLRRQGYIAGGGGSQDG